MKRAPTTAFLLSFIATLGFGREFTLEMKPIPAEKAFATQQNTGLGQISMQKPASLNQEPPATSKRPLYGETGKVIFRLDESSAGKGYDRMIVDQNGNRDLRDDAVGERLDVKVPERPAPQFRRFGPFEVRAEKSKAPVAVYAEAFMTYSGSMPANYRGAVGQAQFYSGCRLETEVELDGVKERIAFADGNGNLILGDIAKGQGCSCPDGPHVGFAGDTILRDRDGSGDYDPDPNGCEQEPLGALVYFGATPYSLALADDLKSVRIEAASGPMAEIKCPGAGQARTFCLARNTSGDTWEAVTPRAENGIVKVPEGKYAIYSCVLAAKDDKGETWIAQGSGSSMKHAIEAKSGTPATLAFGAPIDIAVTTDRQMSGGFFGLFSAPTLRINASLTGTGKETYRTFQKGKETLNPPKFKVVDGRDKVLESGQLEYG